MSESDPERLLAEALRAKAARAPLGDTGTERGFALLAGSDLPLLAHVDSTQRIEETERPPKVWWVLLVAILLGLAAGSVVGLLTLI